MVKSVIPLIAIFFISLFSFPASAERKEKSNDSPKVFVESFLSPAKTVAGLSSVYSVAVYSTVPDILQVDLLESPDFGNLKRKQLNSGRRLDNYLGEKKMKGETYYGYVIDNVVLTPPTSGNFKISGGSYNICIGSEGYADDWFWGRRKVTIPIWIEASAPDINLFSQKRPALLSDEEGISIGEFSVSWNIPPGDISTGSRAIAYYNIKGTGTLDESGLPDFKKLLGDDVNVVYVRPSTATHISRGRLMSEMEILIEFIPQKTGTLILPKVPFRFFDPEKNSIRSIIPEKTQVKVKEDKVATPKAQIYEI